MRGWANDNQRPMVTFLTQVLLVYCSRLTRRARLEAENLILRQKHSVRLWNINACCRRTVAPGAIIIVQPETVIRWHRRGFRTNWRWKSRRVGGRPDRSRWSADPADESREFAVEINPRSTANCSCLESKSLNQPSAGIWSGAAGQVARLEDFPAQSRCRHRFAGFVGAHHFAQAALRLGDPASRPPAPVRSASLPIRPPSGSPGR